MNKEFSTKNSKAYIKSTSLNEFILYTISPLLEMLETKGNVIAVAVTAVAQATAKAILYLVSLNLIILSAIYHKKEEFIRDRIIKLIGITTSITA